MKKESVIVMFAGDSGDGMQLTGNQFSSTTARMGNELSTFPDFPSEIRAPQGTIAGVSGFQIHFGSVEISTPGDDPDVLVAMNPAALKANLAMIKRNGSIIINTSAFDEGNLKKAGYEKNPTISGELNGYNVVQADLKSLVLNATKGIELADRIKLRCKNFCALGITYFMLGRSMETSVDWIKEAFAHKPEVLKANLKALEAGWNYAKKIEADIVKFEVSPAKIVPGKYRQINGNVGTAWGLVQASKAAGLQLFLGTYPITPATEILQELAQLKNFGVKTFQAEDEIAGICSAIGASFGGALAATSTSGPGLSLKSEAMGLAVIYELPLVIINVQRGGPSTGLPTKTEQSDLLQAMFGRNGECPLIIVAASRPNDCFHMAFEACRLSLEHMTPVILMTDGYIANGAEPWKIPSLKKGYSEIKTKLVDPEKLNGNEFFPYQRDDESFVRPWAVPGMTGYEHRVGGLEKANITGAVSHDPKNHQLMTEIRQGKVDRVANNIPLQEVEGDLTGDLLVVSWGGTYGATHSAVKSLREEGKKVSLMHLKYINPMPKNVVEIMEGFKQVWVPELNMRQLSLILNAKYACNAKGFYKIQGLPFRICELIEEINKELDLLGVLSENSVSDKSEAKQEANK